MHWWNWHLLKSLLQFAAYFTYWAALQWPLELGAPLTDLPIDRKVLKFIRGSKFWVLIRTYNVQRSTWVESLTFLLKPRPEPSVWYQCVLPFKATGYFPLQYYFVSKLTKNRFSVQIQLCSAKKAAEWDFTRLSALPGVSRTLAKSHIIPGGRQVWTRRESNVFIRTPRRSSSHGFDVCREAARRRSKGREAPLCSGRP